MEQANNVTHATTPAGSVATWGDAEAVEFVELATQMCDGYTLDELRSMSLTFKAQIEVLRGRVTLSAGWIDPNDKSRKQFLPHIGETVLFCHDGVTYYGIHTGGSFKTGHGVIARTFGTWDCLWMYPPAAAVRGEVQP